MLTAEERAARIDKIRNLPSQLEALVGSLSDAELARHPAAEGAWNSRQVVHHLADSHMNAFIRFKLALTEDRPTVKPYHQEIWAEMIDGRDLPIGLSLSILRGLHARWAVLLDSLTEEQWARQAIHPVDGVKSVDDFLVTYSNHGDNHIAQIKEALAS
jgi:hypothetical protein